MSSAQKFSNFKDLPRGPGRRELVRIYLSSHRGISQRVAARANVSQTMISKVLHGYAVSAKVVSAIETEESEDHRHAQNVA